MKKERANKKKKWNSYLVVGFFMTVVTLTIAIVGTFGPHMSLQPCLQLKSLQDHLCVTCLVQITLAEIFFQE